MDLVNLTKSPSKALYFDVFFLFIDSTGRLIPRGTNHAGNFLLLLNLTLPKISIKRGVREAMGLNRPDTKTFTFVVVYLF